MSNNKAVVTDLPLVLGTNVTEAMSRYDRSTFAADYAIGTLSWVSAASNNNPFVAGTTPYQKERVDQGATAGENSLSNWWLRSATSWHRGAGSAFYDADTSDIYRFRESANVDVWSQGEITLLPDVDKVLELGGNRQPVTCGLGAYWIQSDILYRYRTSTGEAEEIAALTADVQNVTTDGCSALVGASDGVYEVTKDDVVTKLYSAPSGYWVVQSIAFVKDRIMVGAYVPSETKKMHVFELPRNPAAPPVSVTVAAHSVYEYESDSLSFPAITETSKAILVATNIGVEARILSFTVDTSGGGLATLLPATVVAKLPRGEVIRAMDAYLSEYVVLATNRGVRVGNETSDGLGLVYGSLTLEDDVKDIAFSKEFVYATRNTSFLDAKGVWRIHLGEPVDNVYAYAADISADNSTVTGVALVGTTNQLLITTDEGVYVQSSTRKAERGYVKSGAIRLGTTENKQPVSMVMRTRGTDGVVGISVTDQNGRATSFDSIPLDRTLNIPLSTDMLPAVEFEIQLSFERGEDSNVAPYVEEWQMRALPAPVRSSTITIPVLCFKEERDNLGNVRTTDPAARYLALKELEQSGGSVLYQDFSTGEERIAVIRAVQYEQKAPPSYLDGFGGIVTIQLQTVDIEIA